MRIAESCTNSALAFDLPTLEGYGKGRGDDAYLTVGLNNPGLRKNILFDGS